MNFGNNEFGARNKCIPLTPVGQVCPKGFRKCKRGTKCNSEAPTDAPEVEIPDEEIV